MEDEALELAKKLISRPSVTPDDQGCQEVLASVLRDAGFKCETLCDGGPVTNLLALHGKGRPFLLFLGHTDVVPPGDLRAWPHPPFEPCVFEREGRLVLSGRGSADIKSSDAAMALALADFVKAHPAHKGTLGLLVTSNEEGDSRGGTPWAASVLKERGLIPDCCLVGEPSSLKETGDQVKCGRRGSLSAHITVRGVQGHVAYPERCDNAAHKAAALMHAMAQCKWDQGCENFPPTSFQITSVSCDSGAENLAPGRCEFSCNWRFCPASSPESLKKTVFDLAGSNGCTVEASWHLNGLPFQTSPGFFLGAVCESVREVTGLTPRLSTSGGTSDGRFIAPLGAEVAEFGPSGATIHKAGECVDAAAPQTLRRVYLRIAGKICL